MPRLGNSIHGGNVYAASRELGRDVRCLIDFSASINPLGPSPRVWRAIAEARRLITHYPDPDCWELRQALAQYWQRQAEDIVVGNGSTELLDVLPRALKIRHLVIAHPTFSEYAASMARAGGRITTVYAKAREQYAQPIEHLCRLLERRRRNADPIDGVLLCNPNSPTGQACAVDDLLRLADVAQRRKVWLIIDEAFADYCPDRSLLPSAASWPRVVVLRSLTKFYALPGLRVGYAVAEPAAIEAFRRLMPPWSVNVMGQMAALAAMRDVAHVRKSLRFMARERERFGRMLAALPGCSVMPTSANYFFVGLPPGCHARDITTQLRGEGLLIRDCSTVPGANSRSIRLAVRAQNENDRLIRALSRLLQHQYREDQNS
ncbi:MAG: threonine-phosphate decarboxylase CobD [Nitrospira sp.]|nr:threonine-phosphate decarboxylase CobD [Nitrospira sp.]